METNPNTVHQERIVHVQSGSVMLVALLSALAMDAALFVYVVRNQSPMFFPCVVAFALIVILLKGFFTLQPNEARVLVLFGAYKGTVRSSGLHWGNPFYATGSSRFALVQPGAIATPTATRPGNKISLRARTLNGDTLKVNDKRGNPIEIAAVIVWQVQDTAQASFDVDDYENYVPIQSESALRHVANMYPYDDGDGTATTLRNNTDEVSQALRSELQARLAKAGVVVQETRLTHLAYAPEIAQVMLRSQQADAVIAARQKIVHGAVSMVDMALKELAEKDVVQLDDERRAAMVSNLMVVLCSESEVHPVVNTGTLYH